ncbi:MAG TPA: hypothetical protein DD643_02560 [Synechococcus sp. UBA8638]|uniref:hypothetical protein n=1 Tax=Candidatus Synechococcus spongiarum TaxID=431041 RepID=UPI0004B6C7E0|nr:hypothetical protein [Candidatus Synechococcus spongiarum]HBP53290.1 hypothetical protein [Synechococcus sp. UBA8638]
MNALLTAGPESTTLFTITVQESGRSPGRFVGQRPIMVPLNRLQSTHRRLLRDGHAILSVSRCEPIGDPLPVVHPVPEPDPAGLSVAEAPSVTESPSPPPAPQPEPEETALQPLADHAPTPTPEDRTAAAAVSMSEDAVVLLLSVVGALILLTLQVVHHLTQQWRTSPQARQRPDPPAVGVRKRELANC